MKQGRNCFVTATAGCAGQQTCASST